MLARQGDTDRPDTALDKTRPGGINAAASLPHDVVLQGGEAQGSPGPASSRQR